MTIRYLLAAIALITAVPAVAKPTGAPDPRALMEKSRATLLLRGSKMEVTVELRSAKGAIRMRALEVDSRLQDDGLGVSRISRFTSPADAKGLATLLVENQTGDDYVWLYVPALKKIRRMVADGKKERFMGTVLSYGDVLGHRPDQWTHKILGEETWEGHACWSVESTPANQEAANESGYSRRVSCIDKESAFNWKMDTWDLKGRPDKSIMNHEVTAVAEQPGVFSYKRMEALDLQSGERSELIVEKFRYVKNPSADLFRPAALAEDD